MEPLADKDTENLVEDVPSSLLPTETESQPLGEYSVVPENDQLFELSSLGQEKDEDTETEEEEELQARDRQPDPQEQLIQRGREFLGMVQGSQQAENTPEEPEDLFRNATSNIFKTLIAAPLYPLKLAQVLIQLGYEPNPPTRRYSIVFRRYLYYYPGIIGYGSTIARQYGWRALYRGVSANILTEILASTTNTIVQAGVERFIAKLPLSIVEGDDVPDTEPQEVNTTRGVLVKAARSFLQTSISGVVVELIVHPFRVMVVRIIAQHIGQEQIYNSIYGSIWEIYQNEGLSGFYAGIIPALLHRLCSCFIYSSLFVMLELIRIGIPYRIPKLCISGIIEPILLGYIPSSYSYPFALMSNLVAVNNARLVAGMPPRMPVFNGWVDSYRYLKSEGSLYRGSVLIFPRFAYRDLPR